MRQFEVRWAAMPRPVGRRPVLLLTRTPALTYLNKIMVAEVTSTIRSIPWEVLLGVEDGLSGPSAANFDNFHVVSKAAIGTRLGVLAPAREVEAKRALGHALGWAELKVL